MFWIKAWVTEGTMLTQKMETHQIEIDSSRTRKDVNMVQRRVMHNTWWLSHHAFCRHCTAFGAFVYSDPRLFHLQPENAHIIYETEQWKGVWGKLAPVCVFLLESRVKMCPLLSRWVVWTLARWKSCRAGTRGFPSAAQGRRSWSAARCTSPTPTWLEPRSTLPTTPTPPHTSTLTFPSTTSIPTSVWWITTQGSEPSSPGTTGTRCSTTSRCSTSSGATARTTHGAAGGSIMVSLWKVVQPTTHIHSLTRRLQPVLCLNLGDCKSSPR